MTSKILENDLVTNATVEFTDDKAKGMLTIKDEMTPDQKQELMEQYMDELCEKYPDQNATIIVNREAAKE